MTLKYRKLLNKNWWYLFTYLLTTSPSGGWGFCPDGPLSGGLLSGGLLSGKGNVLPWTVVFSLFVCLLCFVLFLVNKVEYVQEQSVTLNAFTKKLTTHLFQQRRTSSCAAVILAPRIRDTRLSTLSRPTQLLVVFMQSASDTLDLPE